MQVPCPETPHLRGGNGRQYTKITKFLTLVYDIANNKKMRTVGLASFGREGYAENEDDTPRYGVWVDG